MLKKGDYLYKQFQTNNYYNISQMNGPTWFALEPNYGKSYGPIKRKYIIINEPRLLDIGNANVRDFIIDTIKPYNKLIMQYADPDYQYSGGLENKKFHLLVQEYFGNKYNGTIIDQSNLQYDKENGNYYQDLEGPSEVVLWNNFNNIIQEIPDNKGGKKKNYKKTIKRKNKKKTYKRKSIKLSI
jgi:hypothetical protein